MHSSLTAVDYLILIILSFTNQVTSAIIVCIAVSNRHHANAACVTKIKSKQAQVDGGRTSLFGQHGVHVKRVARWQYHGKTNSICVSAVERLKIFYCVAHNSARRIITLQSCDSNVHLSIKPHASGTKLLQK